MKKFTVEFSDLKIKSIHETEREMPASARILEEHTGEVMYTTVHAEMKPPRVLKQSASQIISVTREDIKKPYRC